MTKLGMKTWDIFLKAPGKITMPVLEIASKDSNFGFRRKSLEKIKKELKGKDLSMHTQTKRVFTEKDKTLKALEITTLKAEILACSFLGCKELIVHLKQDKLTSKEVETFKELLKLAKKKNVQILYEPNGDFNGKTFLYNLSKFTDLKVNLDLCHLGMAIENNTLKIDLETFLKKLKNKVVYIHASAYDGKEEHVGLSYGKLDWKHVLDSLDLTKVKKIIIEVHKFNLYFKKTKKDLESYLGKRR